MSHGADLNPVLNAAVRRLLRPVVRLLLRYAVPIAAFEEMARRVYVEVAQADFSLPGKKASASRVSTAMNHKPPSSHSRRPSRSQRRHSTATACRRTVWRRWNSAAQD